MPLSNAERQKRRRDKLRREERVNVDLHLLPKLHAKIKRRAERHGRTLYAEIEAILERQKG